MRGEAPLGGPVELAGRTASSRVLFGPHVTNLGHRRGLASRHVAYYERRAAGGTGVIVVESASVHPSDHPYERAPLSSDCADGWSAVVRACRPHGALVLAGLGHAGSQGSTAYTRDALWGASLVADPGSREVPMVVEQPEIDALVDGYATAAALAAASDVDGVEVEAGQWSILRQFLSGLTNLRTDGYGVDRARLLREVLAAVRAAVGPDRIVGLRLCTDELAPWAGITPESAADTVGQVAEWIDYLVPVRGSAMTVGATHPDAHTPPGINRELCAVVSADVPVVLQGSVVDPAMAQAALGDGLCALVEMTRALIADPDLVAHVRAGAPERIRPCTLSNRHFDVRDPLNTIVSDDAEPRAGHESVDPPVEGRDPVPRSVLVVGGGPAGLEAARTLALRGHRVRLVERTASLGGALRWAGALDQPRLGLLIDWWTAELARLGVQVELETEMTPGRLHAEPRVILATGSRPTPQPFPSDGLVLTAAGYAARGGGIGPDVHLLGPVLVHDPLGDGTGAAVAEGLAGRGGAVVLVTPDPVVGAASAGDLVPANARLERAGVVRATHTRLVAVQAGVATLEHVLTGARSATACVVVVDCGHRLPENTLALAFPALPRAGDCVAPRTLHEAVREGRVAARVVVGC